jgi:hypothetical protein
MGFEVFIKIPREIDLRGRAGCLMERSKARLRRDEMIEVPADKTALPDQVGDVDVTLACTY